MFIVTRFFLKKYIPSQFVLFWSCLLLQMNNARFYNKVLLGDVITLWYNEIFNYLMSNFKRNPIKIIKYLVKNILFLKKNPDILHSNY